MTVTTPSLIVTRPDRYTKGGGPCYIAIDLFVPGAFGDGRTPEEAEAELAKTIRVHLAHGGVRLAPVETGGVWPMWLDWLCPTTITRLA